MGIRFDGNAIIRVRRMSARKLLAAGVALQLAHKKRLSVANPFPHDNPSVQGEYPKARTFNLRDSVTVTPISLSEIEATGRVRVGYLPRAFYIIPLAQRDRKTVIDTLREVFPQIKNAVTRS